MISIITQEHKPGLRLKISTGWIKGADKLITCLLSFKEIRAIEQQKQKELHDARLDFFKIN